MRTTAEFWDKVAPRYAAKPISDTASYSQTLARIRSNLPPEARVLELGCGTGATALKLASAAAEIHATDVSKGMIAEAMKRPQLPNVSFAVGDVFNPELEPGHFDVVMALNLAHLIPDSAAFVQRVRDLLAPGGLFISKTPCLAERDLGLKFGLMKAAIPVMQWLGKAPFVRFFSIAELEDEITAAGFEIVETGNFPSRPPSHFVVARAV
ncbi:MAG: methyltransferase domain-containing protein [Pseudomonadota bacterium]